MDGCRCGEILPLIEQGKITPPLITHTCPLRDIAVACELFENRRDGVIKVAVDMGAWCERSIDKKSRGNGAPVHVPILWLTLIPCSAIVDWSLMTAPACFASGPCP